MLKPFWRWLLYKRMGWSSKITEHHPDKYIICLAPHTTNWDFLIGHLYLRAESFRSNFLMKKEWFFWPLSPIFKRMGAIPVSRSKHTCMTDILSQTAKETKVFHLCITPEGTRLANADWKRGFYYIALKAQLPILLYGIDYKRKLIQCTKTIIPNGDIDMQMREIMFYFKDFQGKKPDNFTIGEI